MKVWGMLLCLFALPALAGGQSLAEIARKERERREKLRKAGASARKVTEEDLAAPKGELANDPEKTPAAKPAARPTSRTRSRANAEAAAREKAETQWRGRAAKAQARIDEAQLRCDKYERWIHLGQPAQYQDGRRVAYSIHQLKKMADEAQADLKAAEEAFEDLREEARRAGVPPGWLR